jgi:hypothetical protein
MTVRNTGGAGGVGGGNRNRRQPGGKAFPGGAGAPRPVAPQPKKAAPLPKTLRPEHIRFAQNMVHAADVACLPGPTTDGDMLPRESVSGMFLRARIFDEAETLGRGPVTRDEAARLAIEHHTSGKSGKYYDAVIDDDGNGTFVIKLHLLDPNPPFLPAADPEMVYDVVRDSGKISARA